VNPLELWPAACIENSSRSHVKPVRQKWFDCACCPTNVARTFTSLGQYIYFKNENDVYVNLFIQNETSFEINGKLVKLSLLTDYPKTGSVKIKVKADGVLFSLYIRIPGFAGDFTALINGSPADGEKRNGYNRIARPWNDDEVTVSFSLKPRLIYANPRVHQNCGRAAIVRGPEVYCFEETDNGENLAALSLDATAPLEEHWRADLLGGVMQIIAKGRRLVMPDAPESFSEDFSPQSREVTLTALPYGFWGNRAPGEMLVWIRMS
jgi:DUF1680 family protein